MENLWNNVGRLNWNLRSRLTCRLNACLRVVELKGLVFKTPTRNCRLISGYGLAIPGKGFIKFKNSNKEGLPYVVKGSEEQLQSLVDAHGFDTYDCFEFVQPLN